MSDHDSFWSSGCTGSVEHRGNIISRVGGDVVDNFIVRLVRCQSGERRIANDEYILKYAPVTSLIVRIVQQPWWRRIKKINARIFEIT